MKRNYISTYFIFLLESYIFIRLVDIIYPMSVYSDLDFIQQLFESSHRTRYHIFIIFIGTSLFLFNNILLGKLKIYNLKNVMISSVINYLFLTVLLIVLKVYSLSKLLLGIFSLCISLTNKLINTKLIKDG